MSTEILDLLEEDPAAGILAAADDAEQMAARADEWHTDEGLSYSEDSGAQIVNRILMRASAAYWRAAVRRWREVVRRHGEPAHLCVGATVGDDPCPDLTETADEVRAYLGGAA